MTKSKLVKVNEKIADTVMESYKKIEEGITGNFQKINDQVVERYNKIEDQFIEKYLTKDNETIEAAKKRLREEEAVGSIMSSHRTHSRKKISQSDMETIENARKIRSGQSYLYRRNGFHSTVIDVKMKDKIRGDHLQKALRKTTERFPYFTDKLVEKDGDYLLYQDRQAMIARKTEQFHELGSATVGYHLLDVTYSDYQAAILFSKGIYRLHPEPNEDIVCNIAADLRSAIGMELTHRNCTGTMILPYSQKEDDTSLKDLSVYYRNLLQKQRSVDTIKNTLNKQIDLFNQLEELHTLEEKREKLSFFEQMRSDTYVISYLGIMQFNDFNCYVDSTRFYSENPSTITIEMLASADNITFNILHRFESDVYVQAFLTQLQEANIAYTVEKIGAFHTAKDKSHITASKQSERYFKHPKTK